MGWSQPHYASPGQVRSDPITPPPYAKPHSSTPFTGTATVRTVFVMNDDLLRHGLIHVASQAAGIQVVGESRYCTDLADRLEESDFDLLVLGADMDVPIADLLTRRRPEAKVVAVLDDTDSSRQAVALLRAGVDGLIHRRSPSTELLNTIQRVVDGQPMLDALSSEAVITELRCPDDEAPADHTSLLTRREQEVLALLTEGLDNRTIAKRLFIAEATVKFHLHNIMEKFGVHKRAALVSAALRGRRAGGRTGNVGYLFPTPHR